MAARTIHQVEPGIFRRINPKTGQLGPKLWITYQERGRTRFVSAKTTKITEARTFLAHMRVAVAEGVATPKGKLTVEQILNDHLANQEAQQLATVANTRGYCRRLARELGTIKAHLLAPPEIEAAQDRMRKSGMSIPTVNHYFTALRAAYALAIRRNVLKTKPYIRHIKWTPAVGKYIPPADRVVLMEHLPDHLATLFDFSCLFGIRRGQLARTRRAWVDLDEATITWPPTETKADIYHRIPLDDAGLAIVERAMAAGAKRPWCPYLFHSPRCSPTRKINQRYGCVGRLDDAWRAACAKAGLPVGRKAGGYTYHHSRNTFATDWRNGGGSISDAMDIGGWKTASMAQRYDLKDMASLRARIAAQRPLANSLQPAATPDVPKASG